MPRTKKQTAEVVAATPEMVAQADAIIASVEPTAVTRKKAAAKKSAKKATVTAMVPKDEQTTEAGIVPTELPSVAPAGTESAGDASAPKLIDTPIDPAQPWSGWSLPTVRTGKLDEFAAITEGEGDETRLIIGKRMEDGVIEPLGTFEDRGMEDFSRMARFPAEFVAKLPPALGAQVVNNRIEERSKSRNRSITLVREPSGVISNVLPERRAMVPYRTVAQVTANRLTEIRPGSLELDMQHNTNGKIHVRFLTTVTDRITAHRGDVLTAGLDLQSDYRSGISVALYTRRLVCLNGMIVSGNDHRYSWTVHENLTVDAQLNWLVERIGIVMDAFPLLVDRAKFLAATPFEGDARQALDVYANAMHIPQRDRVNLFAAYEQEPELFGTHWGLLNAVTRYGTHNAREIENGQRIIESAGDWAAQFEMTTASVPMPIAQAFGRVLPAA